MSEILLPCPFCGSVSIFEWIDQDNVAYIECEGCHAKMTAWNEKPGAKEILRIKWNTRASKDDFILALVNECAKNANLQCAVDTKQRFADTLQYRLDLANNQLAEVESENVRLRAMLAQVNDMFEVAQ